MPEHDNHSGRGDTRIALSALHQQSVAIQLMLSAHEQVLKGRGVYEQDPALGRVLRIEFPADVECEIMIREDSWDGEIRSGDALGCDYLIRLS
jgi:hypothetical protein